MKLPSEKSQPSLDDLFAIKRAERPSQEFWDDFQREFHIRQRAAAIEPKRWWFVLPRVFTGLSRYQMPMGAAAVLAVTFLSFREYREPGLEVAFAPSTGFVNSVADPEFSSDVTPDGLATEIASAMVDAPSAAEFAALPATVTPANTEAILLSPLVVLGLDTHRDASANESVSPSARSIAANMAMVRAEQPEIARMASEPRINLTATSPVNEPLAGIAVSASSAREPLFAYQPVASNFGENSDGSNIADVHSKIASRLNDDLLYDSVRRVTAGGDRLTLKF